MNKREMIEKALGSLLHGPYRVDGYEMAPHLDVPALAKQAIVERCTVTHIEACPFSEDRTKILIGEIPGIHGTPGKALCIIVPLEE